jgi:hypothetical protein
MQRCAFFLIMETLFLKKNGGGGHLGLGQKKTGTAGNVNL